MRLAKKTDQNKKKRPRFWLGPFVAGAFCAFGYSITNRLLILHAGMSISDAKDFESLRFPGKRLESLRLSHGGVKEDLFPGLSALEPAGIQQSLDQAGATNHRGSLVGKDEIDESALQLEKESLLKGVDVLNPLILEYEPQPLMEPSSDINEF